MIDSTKLSEKEILPEVTRLIVGTQSTDNPPKFIIVDNITNGFGTMTAATKMRDLLSELKNLKEKFGLTMLLIANSKKQKLRIIKLNDLGGWTNHINFIDSIFAISSSQVGNEFKYIKQIKSRADEKTDEVTTLKITKEPYLSMQYVNHTYEDAHIDREDTSLLMLRISPEQEIKLLQMHKDKCKALDIANKLGLTVGTIYSYLLHNHLSFLH